MPSDVQPAAVDLDVTVVLPVHNEAGHLLAELQRITTAMDQSSYRWELIVVDDGSTDESLEIAKRFGRCRIIHLDQNRGTGSARRIGTERARGRYVVWTDADMSYPNHAISELVDQLAHADQVVGSRRSEEGTLKLLRVPAKWLIRRLASFLSQTKIPDLNSGFRAFRRDVGLQYTHLLPTGFSCVTTLTMAFLMDGYRVTYHPIDYETRAGTSKFHWRRDTSRYLLQVIRMVLAYDPLRVLLPITTAIGLVFAAKLGFDLVDKDFRPAANTMLLGFAALQTLAIGLLADLIVRANRPVRLLPSVNVTEVTSGQTAE
jgi:glycosyltransferase involved in cell wall biosynthesis